MNKRQAIISKVINSNNGYIVLEAIAIEDPSTGEAIPKLLVSDGIGYHFEDLWPANGAEYTAAEPNRYPYRPYIFDELRPPEIPKTDEIFNEVLAEFRRFVDLEDEYRLLLASAVLLSYVQELFDAIPYFYLLGDNESGKTHTLRLISELAYRPLYGVSIPAADLFTFLSDDGFTPTIIEDEIQGIERDGEKSKIWKSGYKRGAKVPRITIKPNGEREIIYYNTYCLKFAAGEKAIDVKGLSERFITINMVEGYPEKDYYDDNDFERFSRIRNRLLLWRCNKLFDPSFPSFDDLDFLRGRMRELYAPLLAVSKETPYFDMMRGFVERKIEERVEAKRNSLEGFLTKIVAEKIRENQELKIEFAKIWAKIKEELQVEEHPARPDRLETDSYGVITKKRIGNRLHEALGSKTKRERTSEGVKVFHIFDPAKLLKAMRKYHVTDVTDVTDFLESMVNKKPLESSKMAPLKPIQGAPQPLDIFGDQ